MRAILVFVVCIVNVNMQGEPKDPTKIDWCDAKLCRAGKKHIACGHSRKFDPSCVTPRFMPITNECKAAILDAHNEYRNQAAAGKATDLLPKAARMAQMEWDPVLAYLASLNCMQCVMNHDDCRNTPNHTKSGQNLGIEYAVKDKETVDCATLVRNRIKDWNNEKNYMTADLVRAYRGPSAKNTNAYGHATALLQDRSIQVGCAVCQFETPRNGKMMNASELACNYASTNIAGGYIYKSGESGSLCVKGRDARYTSMCSKAENLLIDPNQLPTV